MVQRGRGYSLQGKTEAENLLSWLYKATRGGSTPGLGWDCAQRVWFHGEILVIPILSTGLCVKVSQQRAAKWFWEDAAWLELGCGQPACHTGETAEVGEEPLLGWMGDGTGVAQGWQQGTVSQGHTGEDSGDSSSAP